MNDHDRERWRILCEQASKETDPKKLLALVIEINSILAAKSEPEKQPPLPKAG